MKKTIIALFACLGLVPLDLAADVAPSPLTTGGTNLTAKEGKVPVEMTWEIVDLWPSTDKNHCTAVFEFTNTSDKPVEFEVGFPSLYQQKLNDFQVEVDGKKQLFSAKKEKMSWGSDKIFKYWLCWDMKFEANGTRRVKVSYWTETKARGSYDNYLPVSHKKKLAQCSSGYVLRTGKNWKNAIGKATIRIHHDSVARDKFLNFKWDKWTFDAKNNVSEIVYTDLEPNHGSDINYSFKTMTPEEERDFLFEVASKQHVHPYLQKTLIEMIKGKNYIQGQPSKEQAIAIRKAVELFMIKFPGEDHSSYGYSWGDYTLKLAGWLFTKYQIENNDEGIATLRKNLIPFSIAERKNCLARRQQLLSNRNRWTDRRLQELALREAELERVMGKPKSEPNKD